MWKSIWNLFSIGPSRTFAACGYHGGVASSPVPLLGISVTSWIHSAVYVDKISIFSKLVVLTVTEEGFAVGSEGFAEVGQFASAHSIYEKLQLKEGLFSWGDGHTGLEVQSNYSTSTTSSRLSVNTGWSLQQFELTSLLGCCAELDHTV